MSNERRRRIVKELREQGRLAALRGDSRYSNPHNYMDKYQWSAGFDAGISELSCGDADTNSGDYDYMNRDD